MGNRESHLLSSVVPAHGGGPMSRSTSAGLPSLGDISSSSSNGGSIGPDLSLPTVGGRSALGSSVSSLGLSLAGFSAPLAEPESPLRSPVSTTEASQPPTSSTMTAESASQAAAAAAAAQSRPRIHPILRGGRQLSEDLYWVLPPRTKRRPQRRAPPPPPPPPSPPQTEAEATDGTAEATPQPYGPGRTPLDLVRGVTDQVFGITDEESCAALGLHRWDQEAAVRYLKVEQLFRLGLADRDACRDLLRAHGWRLEAACAAVFIS